MNHCFVDCLLCPLLCATQNQEPHREVQSAWGSRSVCMVYIPFQQPPSGLHVLPGSIPYLPDTKMANGPKWATWAEAHISPTKHETLNTKTLSFWFTAPPLLCVLKRKLGPARGGGGVPATQFPETPHRKAVRVLVRSCGGFQCGSTNGGVCSTSLSSHPVGR